MLYSSLKNTIVHKYFDSVYLLVNIYPICSRLWLQYKHKTSQKASAMCQNFSSASDASVPCQTSSGVQGILFLIQLSAKTAQLGRHWKIIQVSESLPLSSRSKWSPCLLDSAWPDPRLCNR